MAKYSRSKLAEYVADHIGDESELAQKVAAFLIENNKTSELGSIIRDVADIRAQKSGIIELTATSARDLSAETKNQIESLVKENFKEVKQIIIHEVKDPRVIGGVNLDFANANLDLTVRAKLNKLREAVA
jgi:F0F1-type ATP synthase delta subunit